MCLGGMREIKVKIEKGIKGRWNPATPITATDVCKMLGKKGKKRGRGKRQQREGPSSRGKRTRNTKERKITANSHYEIASPLRVSNRLVGKGGPTNGEKGKGRAYMRIHGNGKKYEKEGNGNFVVEDLSECPR